MPKGCVHPVQSRRSHLTNSRMVGKAEIAPALSAFNRVTSLSEQLELIYVFAIG